MIRTDLLDMLVELTSDPTGWESDRIIKALVEWLEEHWVELNEKALGSTYEQLIIELRGAA